MGPVIQCVRTTWTEQSRGGEQAAKRNRTPTTFRLPSQPPPFVQLVLMSEADDFEPHVAIHPWPLPGDVAVWPFHGLRRLTVRAVGPRLRVELTADPWAAPRRERRPPGLLLAPGEWLRWQINYRYGAGAGGEWHYALDTVHVLNGPAEPDTFFGEPTTVVDQRAMLR